MDDNDKVRIITPKKIETIEDRLAVLNNSVMMNFASEGVVCVDRDHPEYSRFLKLAIDYAETFGVTQEAERLRKEVI